MRAYDERSSLARADAHFRRGAQHGHFLDLKKVEHLPALESGLRVPGAATLELDELWSFVLKKARKRWIWIALCRETRQVVAFVIGDRSRKTCHRLWQAIPLALRLAHCYTDFWEAYSNLIPSAQHTALGKGSGETAHVERWNLTLRQRLARFVRRTLSFSKSSLMHEACLRLFIHRYNDSHALTLL